MTIKQCDSCGKDHGASFHCVHLPQMTEDQFKNWLTKKGFLISTERYTPYCKWYAWKQQKGWTDCKCNDRPPSVCIHVYELTGETDYVSCEVGITAEAADGWISFKFYSIPPDDVVKKLPGLIGKLKKAWEAVNVKRRDV